MKKYTKNYIGKGKQVERMDIVKVSLKVEDLLKVTHKFEGVEYLTFELARMQNTDEYGRTHTAYVSVREQSEEEEAATNQKADKAAEKAARKSSKKASKKEEPVLEMEDSEIPF